MSERPIKEADRIYNILTRDLGLVRARALSVRKESSKLRGNMEPYALTNVSLVRSKEYWRPTSAEVIWRPPQLPIIARPLALIEKLVQGETPHPELFDAIEFVLRENNYTEIKLVSTILFHLGYLKESSLLLEKKMLIRAINDGLQSSHLT